jgi:hypothetical protein
MWANLVSVSGRQPRENHFTRQSFRDEQFCNRQGGFTRVLWSPVYLVVNGVGKAVFGLKLPFQTIKPAVDC